MLGMFTGEFVRRSEERTSGSRKTLWMAARGGCAAGAGALPRPLQPINKKLWTPAFVFAAGAYSLGMFALFYYIIDVCQWRRWTYFFKVIGVNSITIYMVQRIVRVSYTSEFFFGGRLRNSRPRRPPWFSRRGTSPSAGCCCGSSTGKRYTSRSDRPPPMDGEGASERCAFFRDTKTENGQLSKIIYRISINIICFSKIVSYVCSVENKKDIPWKSKKSSAF